MNISRISIALAITLLLSGCMDSNKNVLKQMASGAPGDLLVVMNKNLWEGVAGDTLNNVLTAPVDALPSNEPLFDVIQIPHSAFAKTFMTQRNILITKIGSDQPEAKILVQKDTWARAQLVLTVVAPSVNDFINLIDTSGNKIIALLNDTERKRVAEAYRKIPNPDITKTLADQYHISLDVPKAYDLDVNEGNFIWLAQEYRDIIQGVLVYFYDYTDANTFTPEYLIAKRNEVLKQHVPGEIPESYMSTEGLFPPLFFEYPLNGNYTAELRGLWRIENGLAMGGPFISITQLDKERNRIVTVDGFVFAPAHEKRELLRQVEAIALSLKIFPESSEN